MAKRRDDINPRKNVRFLADGGEEFYYIGTRLNGNLLFDVIYSGRGTLFEFLLDGEVVRPKRFRERFEFFIMNGPSDGSNKVSYGKGD